MSVTEHILVYKLCEYAAQNKKHNNTLATLARKAQQRNLSGINMEVLSGTFRMICYKKLDM
jgi:hypothetical protein